MHAFRTPRLTTHLAEWTSYLKKATGDSRLHVRLDCSRPVDETEFLRKMLALSPDHRVEVRFSFLKLLLQFSATVIFQGTSDVFGQANVCCALPCR